VLRYLYLVLVFFDLFRRATRKRIRARKYFTDIFDESTGGAGDVKEEKGG
jgi:hypothetical protein